MGGPGPWRGSSPPPHPELALSPSPPSLLALGAAWVSAGRPSPSARVRMGVPAPPPAPRCLRSPGASSSFLPGSPPVATLQPNSVVLLGVAAGQHLRSLESSERFLQPRETSQALLSCAVFLREEHGCLINTFLLC